MLATPAKWKVFSVICVPGSPILCAAIAPIAVPGSSLFLWYREMQTCKKTSNWREVMPEIFEQIFTIDLQCSCPCWFSSIPRFCIVFLKCTAHFCLRNLDNESRKASEHPPSGVMSCSENLSSVLLQISEGDKVICSFAGQVAYQKKDKFNMVLVY